MTAFIIIAALAALALIHGHITQRQRAADQTGGEYDAAQLIDAIRALAALTDQLENADTMLADLAACSPTALLRGFRAQWCGLDGKCRSIDFIADGANGATAGLQQAAHEERGRINAEIIETVRALNAALDSGSAPALSIDAVEKTVDESNADQAAGECL